MAELAASGQCVVCGGAVAVRSEQVLCVNERWFDAVVERCGNCGEVSRSLADVTQMFEQGPPRWVLRGYQQHA